MKTKTSINLAALILDQRLRPIEYPQRTIESLIGEHGRDAEMTLGAARDMMFADAEPLTLKLVLDKALLDPVGGADAEADTAKRWVLWAKLDAGDALLTGEEIVLAKKYVRKAWQSPLVSGQAVCLIDPAEAAKMGPGYEARLAAANRGVTPAANDDASADDEPDELVAEAAE